MNMGLIIYLIGDKDLFRLLDLYRRLCPLDGDLDFLRGDLDRERLFLD